LLVILSSTKLGSEQIKALLKPLFLTSSTI